MRRPGFGLAVVLVLVATGETAPQPSHTTTESQARRASDRLRTLQREADELASEARSLLVDLSRLELQREIRVEEAQRAELLLHDTTAALAETSARLAALETRAQTERPEIQARLVEIYKRGRNGYARMLLGLDDLRSLGRAYRLVSAMASIERQAFAGHRDTLERLRQSRLDLTAQLAAQAAADADARRARVAAEAAVAVRAKLVADIDSRRDLNAQLAGDLQAAQQRLQQSLASLAAGRPVAPDAAALPLKPFRGELDWPALGPLLAGFKVQAGRQGPSRPPNGIEIGLASGLEVKAVHEGSVAYAESFSGFGRLVIVNHGGQSYSLYGYLSELEVARGDRVARGQALGTSGTSPTGTPSLYFELRIDGAPVDPLQWLKRR
jgi:septal ring factor EnvC (AmiA/AmiB activator)